MKKNVYIVVGMTCSGKTTTMENLENEHDYKKMITSTTREPREGEIDGVNYFFLTKESFEEKIKNNMFVEYVKQKGDKYYGLGLNSLDNIKNSIPYVILEPMGAKNAKDFFDNNENFNPIVIFLNVSQNIALERLSKRGSEEERNNRTLDLQNEELNWINYMKYDHIIDSNKSVSEVSKNVHDVIVKEESKNNPQKKFKIS